MDVKRLEEFNLTLLYDDGSKVGGVISGYKPPRPAELRKGLKTISGYTYFQKYHNSDCIIIFTISFQINGITDTETQTNIQKYRKFISNYSGRYTFIDEFGITYKGYIQNKFDIDTPIEGDVYYISVELLCNHEVTGWVADNGEM